MPKQLYKANGKLLLFGEYVVLDGALALAIPTKYHQTIQIKAHRGSDLLWESYDLNDQLWFEAQLSLYDFSAIKTNDQETAQYIQKLLKGAVRYNCEFLDKWNGFKVISKINFPRTWGLGTSSSLIHCVAQWAEIQSFDLHFRVSNGSGYDIACAASDGPLTYKLTDDEISYSEIDFNPPFLSKIYFVHLGKKQSSSEAINKYLKSAKKRKDAVASITELTKKALATKSASEFGALMREHEKLISSLIDMPSIAEQFPDLKGDIKSLGAWGGDFAMVLSGEPIANLKAYFKNHGLDVVIPYKEMAL